MSKFAKTNKIKESVRLAGLFLCLITRRHGNRTRKAWFCWFRSLSLFVLVFLYARKNQVRRIAVVATTTAHLRRAGLLGPNCHTVPLTAPPWTAQCVKHGSKSPDLLLSTCPASLTPKAQRLKCIIPIFILFVSVFLSLFNVVVPLKIQSIRVIREIKIFL